MSLLFTIKSRTGASAEALFLPSVAAVCQYLDAKVQTLVGMTKKMAVFIFLDRTDKRGIR